ncbi:hypothetical protein [Hymenobacter baengnokdamensis]|uniref:hypothetical protein n=1 Tax=Hymenobacter baengnokdamensis TaxID=2615203 RepID=UPI0012479B67|nr:hypothetical protein [Hymenobacter baengnokdamensis]
MNSAAFSRWRAAWGWLARYHGWLLATWWAVVQAGCWRYYRGPHLLGDGFSYVAYARQLADTGTLAGGHYGYYAGYSLFISLFLKTGLGLMGVGLGQVALSGLAAQAFYATMRRLTGGHWPTAALATAALVSWVEVQAFNPFILTESLFTSFLLFGLWAMARVRDRRSGAVAAAILCYTATIRPNGFVALAAAALVGLHHLWQQGRRGWAVAWLLVLAVLAGVGLNRIVTAFNLIATYAAGTVIFDYPPTAVERPASLAIPPAAWLPISQLGWFIAHNFGYFSKLCLLKAIYFLGFPRPWYSTLHRVWVIVSLVPLYTLAGLGMLKRPAAHLAPSYAGLAIALQISVVMMTVEEWGARFSGPFIPYWLLLAALGAQPTLQRWLARANERAASSSK